MAGDNITIVRAAGTLAVPSGIGGSGLPTGAGVPPANVTGLTCSGFVDPIALEIYLTISFTAPSGTFDGVHLWLDIPDHGSVTSMTVGSTAVGTGTVTGPFNPIDLGLQMNPPVPNWQISLPFPSSLGLNANQNIQCRLYASSASAVTVNELVQAGLTNATPNVSFTLVSQASGSPTAATNVTANCGTITVQVLPNDNSTGKLMTPFLALMGSVPSNPPKNWGYKLYISYGDADPTNPANLTPITDVLTTAGVIPASTTDTVTDVLNSFALSTPTSVVNATIWAIAGLAATPGSAGTAGGAGQAVDNFTPNNVVPGVTNSCPVSFGTTSGTIDASQAIQSSISDQLTIAEGALGITPNSLSADFLAADAALANIGIGGLLAEYMSGGAALTNLGAPLTASTLISEASITGALIAAETITGTLLATSGIITTSAQIGYEVVGASNIGSCNVSSLLAGTATFTSTVVFESSSGPSVIITSSEVEVTGGSYTIAVNSSSGISISSSYGSLSATSSGISITAGSNSLTVTSSNITLTNVGNSTTTNLTNATVGGYYSGLEVTAAGYSSYVSSFGFLTYYGTTEIIQLAGGGGVGSLLLLEYGGSASINLNPTEGILVNGSTVVNTSGAFVGAGVSCPSFGVECAGINIFYSSSVYYGQTSYAGSLSASGGGYGLCGQVYVGGVWYQVVWGTEQGVNEAHSYVAMLGGVYVGFCS